MAEISVQIPNELKQELDESGVDVQEIVKEALTSRLFEKHLAQSKALQRAMFETLIAKSKLTEKDAQELADKVNTGMLKELKKHGW